ncbi:MAG: glutamyl-tRNA reductase, partial [Cyanobacteriota bacterium]
MQMLLIGLSFKNASINIREKVSFSQNEIENVLFKLKCYDEIKEIVILSTCNRTEFYIITDELEKTRNFLITFIEKEKNINFNSIQDSFYTYYNKFA